MSRTPQVLNGHAGIDAVYPGKMHEVQLSSEYQTLEKLSGNTTVVRVWSSQHCFVKTSTGEAFLPKEQIEYFAVDAGTEVSVKGSGGGQFYLSEGA